MVILLAGYFSFRVRLDLGNFGTDSPRLSHIFSVALQTFPVSGGVDTIWVLVIFLCAADPTNFLVFHPTSRFR